MAFIINNNVKINYKVEGEGDCLVLQHGLYGSLEDWYEYGYVDALKKRFKLILIDARGHGKSDKPHISEEYSLYLRALDVIMVLDAEKIENCHYMGYSMGGWISFGLMNWFPSRINSFILSSIHPYENNMNSIQEVLNTIDIWVPKSSISDERKQRILQNDSEALWASVQDKREDNTEALRNIEVPCLVIAGEDDEIFTSVKEGSKLSNKIKFVPIPKADHISSLSMSVEVIMHIQNFLDSFIVK